MREGIAFAAGLLLAACSDDGDGASDRATSEESTPTITQVIPMAGGLHVIWKKPSTACDSVEGERKAPNSAYELAFVVPGAFDNKHDGKATGHTEYTYRLRCKRGDAYSEYSNEMTGKPEP